MVRAKAAWDNGDFDLAPSLYQAAITAGGLKRADVIDAYVRIGAALRRRREGEARPFGP